MQREIALGKTFGNLRRQLASRNVSGGASGRTCARRNAPPRVARIDDETERVGRGSEREGRHFADGSKQKLALRRQGNPVRAVCPSDLRQSDQVKCLRLPEGERYADRARSVM